MRRPDVFTLDYSHPLAQGLVFFPAFNARAGRPVDLITRQAALRFFGGWGFDSVVSAGAEGFLEYDIVPAVNPTGDFTYHGVTNQGAQYIAMVLVGQGNVNNMAFCGIKLNSPHNVNDQQGGAFSVTVSNTEGATKNNCMGPIQPIGSRRAYTAIRKDGVYSLYIDGAPQTLNSANHGTRALTTSAVRTLVGGLQWQPGINNWRLSTGVGVWDAAIYNRALSPVEIALLADRTDPMLGGLIVEERPVLYFDMGGEGTDALTATDLVTGSPVLGTPSLGQVHALTATGITVEGPVLGAPTLAQIHALVASGVTVSAPVLGTPAVGQAHSLVASALVVGAPVLGAPTLTENAPDVDALTSDDLVVGNPVLGAPALGQVHVLGSDGLVTGAPVLGQSSITQVHALSALGLTVGVPVLGMPALNGSDIVPITAAEVARIVRASSRMKTVTASARVKQVRYEVTRA